MPLPVISIAQMREWEQSSWAAGRSEAEVIGCVGRLVAARALRLTHPDERLLILAGKGHNGDDARAAIPHLANRQVDLLNIASPGKQLADARSQLEKRPALILDGLFGVGLNRTLRPDWIALIKAINESRRPILAIDTPSGLNADTGKPEGAAIQATITLTLAAPKRGLLAASALPFVGRLEVEREIGLIPSATESDQYWTCAEDFDGYPPPRALNSHKGSFGHLLLIAGSEGFHGAAVLAARAAARSQPGLITVRTSERTYLPVASQLQSAMVQSWRRAAALPEKATGLVIGPGLADPALAKDLKDEVKDLWCDFPHPVLADASALDWLPPGPVQSKAPRMITPHPGEAARVLRMDCEALLHDRRSALLALSRQFGGCWVVLKGHQTIIGREGFPLFLNPSGNPFLAQGGSGDVLAGFLGGLMAQPALQNDPLLALRYGVWRHGLAADRLSEQGKHWVVEDLVQALAEGTRSELG